jgi:hypothetical protein
MFSDDALAGLREAGKKQAFFLMKWLSEHPDAVPPGELLPQLSTLQHLLLPPRQKLHLLEALFERLPGSAGLDAAIARFIGTDVPLSRTVHAEAQTLLQLLDDFAQAYETLCVTLPADAGGNEMGVCLERALFFLYKQLCLGYLLGQPVALGLWLRLHNACLRCRLTARGEAALVYYVHALLLSLAQPYSLSARELAAVVYYVQQRGAGIVLREVSPEPDAAVFWIPAQQDVRPFPLIRRIPPQGASVLYFSCAPLAARVQEDLAGAVAVPLPLPARAQRRLLLRLLECWGKPRLRRFKRLNKADRGILCVGLASLHAALACVPLHPQDAASRWMITNESPDGYGLMLLSGDTEAVAVGNMLALQADSWVSGEIRPRLGVIRWLASATPEHLEIGVHVLSTRAVPALLNRPEFPKHSYQALYIPAEPMREQPLVLLSATLLQEAFFADFSDNKPHEISLTLEDGLPRPARLLALGAETQYFAAFWLEFTQS